MISSIKQYDDSNQLSTNMYALTHSIGQCTTCIHHYPNLSIFRSEAKESPISFINSFSNFDSEVVKTAKISAYSQIVESKEDVGHRVTSDEIREADKELKRELSEMKSNAKHFEKESRAAIRELPHEERAAARKELREDIHERRKVERELKKEIMKDRLDNSVLSLHRDERDTNPMMASNAASAANQSMDPAASEINEALIQDEILEQKKRALEIDIEAQRQIVRNEESVLRAEKLPRKIAKVDVETKGTEVVGEKK